MTIMGDMEEIMELAKETGLAVGDDEDLEALQEEIRQADAALETLQRRYKKLTGRRYRWFK